MKIGGVGLVVTVALGILAAPLPVDAQQKAKMYRIGFLGNSTATLEANLVGPFRDGYATSATRRAETS